MPSKLSFFLLLFVSLSLISCASAQQIVFNDLNMVGRDVSIYQINETGSHLVYQGATTNATYDFNTSNSYQVVFEPSKFSWFDDPMTTLKFFIHDGAGQAISFCLVLITFGALIRLAIR